MSTFKSENGKHIISCPDCGRINLEKVTPSHHSNHTNHTFFNDPLYANTYLKHYPNEHPSQATVLSCPYCKEDWFNDVDSDNGHSYEEYIDFKGMFPVTHANFLDFTHAKDPGFNEACHYPETCNCGECPDPNQLKFNLKGASSSYDVVSKDSALFSWFSPDIKAWFI